MRCGSPSMLIRFAVNREAYIRGASLLSSRLSCLYVLSLLLTRYEICCACICAGTVTFQAWMGTYIGHGFVLIACEKE